MSPPLPLPERPEDAVAILAQALSAATPSGGALPREAALGAFRRYLARVQHHVQDRFEAGGTSGLRSGRLLGRLMDGEIGRAHV